MRSGVLSPLANRPCLGLLGNPENRRIRDFQKAVEALGKRRPACLSYEDLLRNPDCLERFAPDFLRIDSPGENEGVARSLIALGGGPQGATLEFGEISFLKEYYRGFCTVLEWIAQRGVPCLNSPYDIRVMFDKWACHQRFLQQSVARPPSEQAPADFPSLLALMRAKGNGQCFLKPLHGSSASGVCALRWTSHHQQLIAPLQIRAKQGQPILVNSLRICTYTSLAEMELILGLLLPQGMILEQWIPKLTLPGGAVDLRVLVIAGEARHWVARQSRHPMTNLHLGNQRGDITALRERLGSANLNAAFQLAERAAACFPDSLYAGVDILIDSRHQPLVGEINAFGDLLPRLLHRGESAYSAIAAAAYRERQRPCRRFSVRSLSPGASTARHSPSKYPALPHAPPLHAILFDLDNTLVDRDTAFRRCVEAHFKDPVVRAELLSLDRGGRGKRDAFFAFWERHTGLPMNQALFGRLVAERLQPDRSLLEILKTLSQRIKLGIITNGGGETQRAKLRVSGLAEAIPPAHVWVSDEVGTAKPDPAIFLLASRTLGAPPANCLYVGDREHEDMAGASAAGMRALRVRAVLTGERLQALLREEQIL